MKKLYQLGLLMVSCILAKPNNVEAQLVSGNVFLKGQYLEVGIAPNQQHGSNVAAPTGYHPRGGGGGYANCLGFVADPALDGWTVGTPNYIGCYFLPGTPQEGWDMSIDGTWFRAYAWTGVGTDMSIFPGGGGYTFTGSNTDYWTDGPEVFGKWEGAINDLEITTITRLDTNLRFFIGEVKLKNSGTTTYEDIFYSRTLDPDNESSIPYPGSGDWPSPTTTNVIHYQPDAASGEMRALVSATGLLYPTLSYLGIGAVDCRATVYIRTTTTTGGTILYPGTGPHHVIGHSDYNKTVGFTNEADCATGIIFNIGDLEPGDSTTFSYVYVLRTEDLDSAFATLAPSLTVGESSVGTGDTIRGCVGDTVEISVVGGEHYIWDTWLPSEGLLDPPGRTNRVIITEDTITYYIIGSTAVCEMFDTLRVTILPYVLGNPGADSTIELCGNVPPMNLIDYLAGDPEVGGVWTGPGVSASGIFTPSGLPEGTYTFDYTFTSGSCDTFSTLTIQVINDVDLEFTYEVFLGCDEDTVQFTNLTDSLVYFRWNYGDGSPFDTANFSPMHIYEDQGEYNVWLIGMNERGCVDSIMETIALLHPLEAMFTMSIDSVCQGTEPINFNSTSIGTIESWFWDFGDGNTSTLQHPTHTYEVAGTYTVTLIVTDNVPCSDTTYATVYVDSVGSIEIDVDKEEICGGDMVRFSVDFLNTTEDVVWNFGDGSFINEITSSMTHSYPDPGTYYISVTANYPVCPPVTALDTVYVKQYPQINLGPDTQLCLKGAPIMLDPTIMVNNPPGTIYYWSTGDTVAVLKITEPGTYRITANLDGCITSDEIDIDKDCYTDVPNSFTPNGDGVNDYFYPRQLLSEGVVDFTMTIYNRWGEKIFETSNPDGRGWDGKFGGKDQPMGVYVYQISVRYKNQAAEKYTGNVTLLR